MKILETKSITSIKGPKKPKIEFHIDSLKGKYIKEPEERYHVKDKTHDYCDDLFDNYDDLRMK